MPLRLPMATAGLLVCACAGVPAAHPDRSESATITIEDGRLRPSPVVHVRPSGTVVFRPARGTGPIEVTVSRPLAPSLACATMLGFAAEGNVSVARGVAPPSFVSLCFHEQGTFPFVVRTEGKELHGTVRVEPEAP